MAKKRDTTFRQRLLFQDMDLAHPVHDEIMEWLDKTAPLKLSEWLGVRSEFSEKSAALIHREAQMALEACVNYVHEQVERDSMLASRLRDSTSPLAKELSKLSGKEERDLPAKLRFLESIDISMPSELPPMKVGLPVWEFPIIETRYREKSVAGNADMMLRYSLPELFLNLGDLRQELFGEWLNRKRNDDFVAPTYFRWHSYNAFFEVKTEIPSLGELMRQLQFYRAYTQGDWFVVSPDARHKDILVRQGIRFIEYQPS